MRILDQILAWLLLLFACLHGAITFAVFHEFTMDSAWFFSAAIAMALTGALNLLRIRYASAAPGVRLVSIAANFILLAFTAAVATRVPMAHNPQIFAVGAVLAAASVLSLRK
jgi:hypothetical protein